MKYEPHPIDLNEIDLNIELEELIEVIAKNIHETWSFNRVKEGWTYGEKRDDLKKTTPCLVPYEELPEIEKEYDRNTARTTIVTILKNGYKIEK